MTKGFPASGYRSWSTGALSGVSSVGYYWSALPISETNGYYLGFFSTVVNPLTSYARGYGFSVRSVSE